MPDERMTPLDTDAPLQYRDVHAGFWRRACAYMIDFFIVGIPGFIILSFCMLEWTTLIVTLAPLTFVTHIYRIGFHTRKGATPGKQLLGIRVIRADGEAIELDEAFLRSAVDIAFAIILAVSLYVALLKINAMEFNHLPFLKKNMLLNMNKPSWDWVLQTSNCLWFLASAISVCVSAQRRALHDFIAGTVVIKSRYANRADLGKLLASESPNYAE